MSTNSKLNIPLFTGVHSLRSNKQCKTRKVVKIVMTEPCISTSYDSYNYFTYVNPHQEGPILQPTTSNGSQHYKPVYTKHQLTQVYDQMATRDQLVVPFDCDIPVTLHREGVMVGYQEFVEDKWVCMGCDGNVLGPMRKAEVLKGSNVESVVPLSWFRQRSVSLAQFAKIWEELEEAQKENRQQVMVLISLGLLWELIV